MGTPAVSADRLEAFPHTWSAKVLPALPLIAPARQFTYPRHVPGEEDAMQRGALLVEVKPATGGVFLATAALGFRDPTLPSGLLSCPNPDDLLILAGGYAYLIDTLQPEKCLHLPLRPVAAVMLIPEQHLIVVAGFHHVIALDAGGLRWQSKRLSTEGIQLERVEGQILLGSGWDMRTDLEVPFTLDLRTGEHSGGVLTP